MTRTMGERFGADPNALFDVLLPLIADDMLIEIASADYGWRGDEHLGHLMQFRDRRTIPILGMCPGEVLDLIRWSEPDQPDWKPGSTGRRGHLIRAFSCAMLLRAYEHPDNVERWLSFNETTIQLALSLNVLGGPLDLAGGRFFAWCLDTLSPLDFEGAEGSFFGLALLSFVFSSDDYSDCDVIDLCKWIDENTSILLEEYQHFAKKHFNWLLSTNHHDQRNDGWIELGRKFYHWAEAQAPSERATWVARIGRALAEE